MKTSSFMSKVFGFTAIIATLLFATYVTFSFFAPTITRADDWGGDWGGVGDDFSTADWGGSWNTAGASDWGGSWNTAGASDWSGSWNTASNDDWGGAWNTSTADDWSGSWNTATADDWGGNWNTASAEDWGGSWNTATAEDWGGNWNTASAEDWGGNWNTASAGDFSGSFSAGNISDNSGSFVAGDIINNSGSFVAGDIINGNQSGSFVAGDIIPRQNYASVLGAPAYGSGSQRGYGASAPASSRYAAPAAPAPSAPAAAPRYAPQPRQQIASATGPAYQTPSYYPQYPQQPQYYPQYPQQPIQPPVAQQPNCQIQVSQTQIEAGDTAQLYWSSNGNSASISTLGTVQASGTRDIRPAIGSHTYTMTVRGVSGSTATCRTTITVTRKQEPIMQPSCQMSVSQSQINLGESATLYWTSTNATAATISGMGTVQLSGSREVRPAVGTHTYTMNVRGNSNTQATCTATITVTDAQPMCRIDANRTAIDRGDSVVLSWTSDRAVNAAIQGIGQVAVNGTYTVNPLVTTTYTMHVRNQAGREDTCTVTVSVRPTIPSDARCAIYADRQNINRGEVVTLSWAAQGASSAYLSGFGQVPLVGTRTVAPQSNTSYVLNVSGNGIQETCTVAVNVNNPLVLGSSTSRFIYPEVPEEPEYVPFYQRVAQAVLPQTIYRYIASPVETVVQQPVIKTVVQRPQIITEPAVVQPIVRVINRPVVAGVQVENPTVRVASAIELPLEQVSLAPNTTPETGFEDMILPFFFVAFALSAIYAANAVRGTVRIG